MLYLKLVYLKDGLSFSDFSRSTELLYITNI